jgi:hypothetical protein
MSNRVVRRNAHGEYYYHCKDCKVNGDPHYARHSAENDPHVCVTHCPPS